MNDAPLLTNEKSPIGLAAGQRSVHVVDDDAAVLRALDLLLDSAGFACVTHGGGASLLAALGNGPYPGCVVTDLRMPEPDGLALLRLLRQREAAPPVIVMTAHGDISTAVQAMKLGAYDFLEKPFQESALLRAVEGALARPSSQLSTEAVDASRRIEALSPRERQVLELLLEGKPNKVIAQMLSLSPRTVEVHRGRVMARLGVHSVAEAMQVAARAECRN
jgi:two-component system response regulator FixJ